MSAAITRESLNEAQDNVPVEFTIRDLDDTESGANENAGRARRRGYTKSSKCPSNIQCYLVNNKSEFVVINCYIVMIFSYGCKAPAPVRWRLDTEGREVDILASPATSPPATSSKTRTVLLS